MDLRSMDEIASAEADEYEALFKALGVPYERTGYNVGAKVVDLAEAIAKLVARIEALERKVGALDARPFPWNGGPLK